MSSLNDVVQAGRYLLQHAPEAEDCRAYLNSRLSPEMQEAFSFGFFPNGSGLNLMTSFLKEEELKSLNLLYSKEIANSSGARSLPFCFFEHHPLIMPYRDVYGNVIAIIGRTLLNEEERTSLKISKYKNTRFIKGNHLFGLFEAKESILKQDLAYVVEGQFDVIKAAERGLRNVISLGSADMSAYQFSLLCRYTNNILLLLDNDEAGEKGRRRAINKFSAFAKISNVYLPSGYKDMDEYMTDCLDIGTMELLAKI